MRRVPCLWLCFLISGALVWGQRPLSTESAVPVGGGKLVLELGLEHQRDAVFALSGLAGDVTRIGVVGLRVGAGQRVEFQILGTIRDFLTVQRRNPAPLSQALDFGGGRTDDVGDFALATKFQLKEEGKSPALGFRFGVELPNASNESGLGVDETNAFGGLLVSKHLGRALLHGNVGILILGDPLARASQDDLVVYGIAADVPVRHGLALALEVSGRAGPGGIATDDRAMFRAVVRISSGSLVWDAGVLAGLTRRDPNFGVSFGISKTIF